VEIAFFLVIWIILSAVAGVIAENKGNSFIAAFLISFLLSPLIGIIIAAAEKPNEAVVEKRRLQTGESRKCPFCAEVIKKEATVCRYCGRDLADASTQTAPLQELKEVSDKADTVQAIKLQMKQQPISLLVGGVLVALLIIVSVVMQTKTKTDQHVNDALVAANEDAGASDQQTKLVDKSTLQVTLTRAILFQLKYGRVTLYPGTKLPLISRNGDDALVNYEGEDFRIPISATDLK
jgi:hypothetical protein